MRKIDGIILTVTNYTYTPGYNSIRKSVSDEVYRDFQIYMASELGDMIVSAIDKQRYAKGNTPWKPLSIKYYTWKKRNRLSLNIWEATGTLKKEIKIFKKGNFIAVGFKNLDHYPNSSLQINKVARYLEFGGRRTQRPPARPLFRPLTIYMRKNVSRYYKKYLKELDKSGKKFLYL